MAENKLMITMNLQTHHIYDTQEFVQSLSTLLRGTMEEKLRWAFSLYDINGA